jgi:hypothetical protein
MPGVASGLISSGFARPWDPRRLKGVLGASDFLLETVVETANRPEAIRTIRNSL